MTEYERSEWIDKDNVREFVENSDNFLVERKRQFKILASFYSHFLKNKGSKRIMDLGCGDGRVTAELLKFNEPSEFFLVDGSSEMLKTAKTYLGQADNIHYINKTFQDLIKDDSIGDFDLIVSSLAIHHLSSEEKNSLFKYIYNHLKEGGFFLNLEVVLSPTSQLEDWYLVLWKEWIVEKGADSSDFQNIPLKYKKNPDNNPDTLDKQLNMLKKIGFKNVDCHYKYGIFSIYSGER